MAMLNLSARSSRPFGLGRRAIGLLVGAGICVATVVAPATVAPVMASEFTPAQRAEIVQIIRDAMKTDPSILRDAVSAFQADQAAQQAAAASAAITSQHDAVFDKTDAAVGSNKPDVTIVEFFDPRCPYCRGLESAMSHWLKQDPRIRLVYKDLPILGPASVLGSRALLAAQRQGDYVALRERIMAEPPNFTDASIRADADKLGLNWARLQKDMNDPAIQKRIDDNVHLAKLLGIEGTPAFVVGNQLVVGSDVKEVQNAVAAVRGQHG